VALPLDADEFSFLHLPNARRPDLRLVEQLPPDAAFDVETTGLFVQALLDTLGQAVRSPAQVASAVGGLAGGVLNATAAMAGRAFGRGTAGPIVPGRDPRFADRTWETNAAYWWLRQIHLLNERFLQDVIDAAPLQCATRGKAKFVASLVSDALAPTNTLLGNPAALKRAFETGGQSVLKGAQTMLSDLARNGGWPAQVDSSQFETGRNIACTPGRVVYRSELLELIQYSPSTEQVHEIPLLFCPPWINKYYIFDLSPGRSLIEWAVAHGHTTFAISYRNPDASLRDHSFTEYVTKGPLEAVQVVKEITGVDLVNTMSVCLGGTLTAFGMAYEAAKGTRSINTASMINTHTDFTRPGILGVFTDERTVALIERHMLATGSLSRKRVAQAFSLIRANDLIFDCLVKNWLMGEDPPAFDLLAWNDDGTDMPPRLHSDFLRWCYLENRFAEGRMELAGTLLEPGDVDAPTYVVSAVNDHIVPWESAYQTPQLLGGDDHRFVLSTGGHIAAIVNPPSPKSRFWTNEALPPDAADWLAGAEQVDGTWWEDWAGWIGERAGALVDPPRNLGSDEHPPLGDAPGVYAMRQPATV
jgi:polyhydroxyalkanoate synthase